MRARLERNARQLVAVFAERLGRSVGDFLALGQIQMLDVVAVLSKGADRLVADALAAFQRQIFQESAAALRNVLDDGALSVFWKS